MWRTDTGREFPIRKEETEGRRDPDARLGLFMYSTQDDLDKLLGIKKKRGRKSKNPVPS